MLSKIEFFESNHDINDLTSGREELLPPLRQYLQSSHRDVIVAPAPGGTLGLCFDAQIAGQPRFLKTHLASAGARASLAKEIDLLQRLYGRTIVLDRFEMTLPDGSTRLCLLMPALTPLATPMRPEVAAALAREWDKSFEGVHPNNLASFEQYLACAARALAALSDRHLLKTHTLAEVSELIGRLDDRLAQIPRVLSHGDFAPKNIMIHGADALAIDWEDAFCGIPGYDYLYWLTFIENRPFLQSAAFGRTELGPDIERAILALVVVLKSYLSVRSGAYRNHAVSIETRIAEILELPN